MGNIQNTYTQTCKDVQNNVYKKYTKHIYNKYVQNVINKIYTPPKKKDVQKTSIQQIYKKYKRIYRYIKHVQNKYTNTYKTDTQNRQTHIQTNGQSINKTYTQ